VAYSGEIDRQKQAADIMAAALEREGIELTHIVGPKTAHKYHPDSKIEINERIDAIAARGRDPLPRQVKFSTYTLRYNKSDWITLDALEEHWSKARIDARIIGDGIQATTTNISALTFEIRPGLALFTTAPQISIDGQNLTGKKLSSDRSWRTHLRKASGRWSVAASNRSDTLAKRPGLQGPIDDAFMDSFILVVATGHSESREAQRGPSPFDLRVRMETEHAIEHWRKQFRGEARVIRDTEVTPEHVESANLVLWGTPQSNAYLAKIAGRLPVRWENNEVRLADRKFSADKHLPVLIYPNPENPDRYIVLNSGFTFREYDYLNNARQVAKLPDYAILDISVPPNSRYAGKVVTAGFFDETWQLPKE
jgi:hypothetical protein